VKYESYSVRQGFILFKKDLEECRAMLGGLTDLPNILMLQKNILFLLEMAKRQSLYVIEDSRPCVVLSSCHNSLMNIKSEFLDSMPSSDIMKAELVNINTALTGLIDSVAVKCNSMDASIVEPDNVKQTVERLEDFRAPAELIQNFKDAVKDKNAKTADEVLYDAVNKRIKQEIRLIERTMEAGLTFVRGSIAVNSYIRSYDLKGLDYSVLKIPGISFTHTRKEVITPVYVFHNQRLAIINVKKRIVSIGRSRFRNADEVFNEKLEAIERSTDLINQTKKFHTPYLMSPAFKNVRFLWFSENLEAFKNIKEGTVRMLC
jgi:hypothetical protein